MWLWLFIINWETSEHLFFISCFRSCRISISTLHGAPVTKTLSPRGLIKDSDSDSDFPLIINSDTPLNRQASFCTRCTCTIRLMSLLNDWNVHIMLANLRGKRTQKWCSMYRIVWIEWIDTPAGASAPFSVGVCVKRTGLHWAAARSGSPLGQVP